MKYHVRITSIAIIAFAFFFTGMSNPVSAQKLLFFLIDKSGSMAAQYPALVQFNGIFQENHPDLSGKTAGCRIFGVSL